MSKRDPPPQPEPGARPCPQCGESMEPYRTRGVDLDRCHRCMAVWFDAYELAAAARCALPPVTATGPSQRRCPTCRTPLERRRMGPVEVDGCRTCHGIFLDGGEFEELRKGRAPVRLPGWSDRSKPRDEYGLGLTGFLGAAALAWMNATEDY